MLREAPDQFPTRRVLIAAIVLLAPLAALIFVTVSFRSDSRNDPGLVPTAAPHESGSWTRGSSEDTSGALLPLSPTADPETFARNVAEALFGWDTTTFVGRNDLVEVLMKAADPTGESAVGLLSDLNAYLPTQGAWRDLAQYSTRQWLSVDSVTTPDRWTEAQAQAGDMLLPGTTARTVRGVRHRSGVWNGEAVSTEHGVSFSIFMVCRPSYPTCHLLRLSILDRPLD